MVKTGVIGAVVVIIVVIVAAAAYIGTQPAAPSTTTPTTTTPKTTTTTTTTTAEEPLKVAVIYISPLEGEYWNLQLHEPLLDAVDTYGIEYNYTESVAPPDADRIARTYIDQGYELLFFHSWFPDAIKMVGTEFPNVVALGAGGGTELVVLYPPPVEVPSNVGHYDTYMHESGYLNGVLAGSMTKTNKIGIVTGFPVANVNRYHNGFIQGAREVNPEVEIKMTYIYSWSDPPLGKESALAFIEWGADFIYSDMLPGAEAGVEEAWTKQIATEENPIYVISIFKAMPELAPNSMISSNVWDLRSTVDKVVSDTIDGNFEAREYLYGIEEHGAELVVNMPEKVPDDILDLLEFLEQSINDGQLVILPNINDPEQVWGL